MKVLNIFFRYQFLYFIVLFVLFPLPLFLFFKFSTYPLPKIQYVFLAVLFISQYALFKENNFKRRNESKIKERMTKEMGRIPSYNEICKRLELVVSARSLAIGLNLLFIVLTMIIFYQF